MARPWAEAGYDCWCFDILNDGRYEPVGRGGIHYVAGNVWDSWVIEFIKALHPEMVFGFPPCDDMATCGAKHFARKLKADPLCQRRAAELAKRVETIAGLCGARWCAENPRSVLSTLWRKPDHKFTPWQYGGYLPLNDVHPRWPEFITARDAYPKETWIWSGGGFVMPLPLPVAVNPGYSLQFRKLGGKSAKTKQIRSETPRGFARAVFLANYRYLALISSKPVYQ